MFLAALVVKEDPLLEGFADFLLPDPRTSGQTGGDLEGVEGPPGIAVGVVNYELPGRIIKSNLRTPQTALFIVKATITPEKEEGFNRWYHEVHIPDVLKYPGCLSARRYKALSGEDKFQYMAVYEFQDQATLEGFLKSDHLKGLAKDYEANYGPFSERARMSYLQVYP